MKKIEVNSQYNSKHQVRFNKTMEFLQRHVKTSEKILDLGPTNPFSSMMKEEGFQVDNTSLKTDLDLDYKVVENPDYDVLTAFEILEHLVSPFPLLRYSKATKLLASVPLNLWFANAYWNDDDPYDRHYHEFESRQFDMLLDKAGWKIKDSEKWINQPGKIGIRPLLRKFTPRHYIVYCERKTS